MAMTPTRVPSARPLAVTCSTGPTTTSTIDWSRDHRGIKQRYYPMRGFGSVASASRFCRAFDEVRQFFRARTTMKQKVSLAQQRDLFRQRWEALRALELVA